MKKRKALIYCRVSSRSQEEEGSGLSSQETRCRQHAAAKGYEVTAVFPDTISGGGDFMKRPGLVALLDYIDLHPHKQFVVIFDDLKRFARDRDFHFRLRDAFRERQARIECLNFNFDETPEGEFIETIMAAQGQLERKQNARQVAQKMKARMENGYYVLRAPLGYRYERVKGRGKMLFPDEPFASIIREGFEGFASGRFGSQAEVTRFFNTFPEFPRGKGGHVLEQRTIDILSHPIYTGHICSDHYDVHWLKGHHEAIISLETFERVQARRKGTYRVPKRANIGKDFALRGVVACACCGTKLSSSWSRGNTRSYAYYLCQKKGCAVYGKSIPRDEIESQVGEILKALQPSRGLLRAVTDMFRQAWDARENQAAVRLSSTKQEITRLEKEIETVLDRIMTASNQAIIRRYEEKVEDLERRKAGLVESLSMSAGPKGTFEDNLEIATKFLANPWKIWEKGDIDLRRLVLKLAFCGPIKYCRSQGPRTPEISLPFRALDGKSGQKVCYGG